VSSGSSPSTGSTWPALSLKYPSSTSVSWKAAASESTRRSMPSSRGRNFSRDFCDGAFWPDVRKKGYGSTGIRTQISGYPSSAGSYPAQDSRVIAPVTHQQLVVQSQQTLLQSFPSTMADQWNFDSIVNWSPPGCLTTPCSHGTCRERKLYFFLIRWAFFLRRIFFFRHFQRCLPRFFQAREPLFIRSPSYIYWAA